MGTYQTFRFCSRQDSALTVSSPRSSRRCCCWLASTGSFCRPLLSATLVSGFQSPLQPLAFAILKLPLPAEFAMERAVVTVTGQSNQLERLRGFANDDEIS